MGIGMNKGGGAKQAPKPKTKPETSSENTEEVDDIDDFTVSQSKSVDKRMIILGAIAVIVIIAIIFAVSFSKKSTSENNTESQSTEQTGSDLAGVQGTPEGSNNLDATGDSADNTDNTGSYQVNNGGTSSDNTIKPGITNYDEELSVMTTGATVYSANDFIKDLNGLEVSAIYNVESIEYVTDYVNYETRRASMDDGMELYWIEAKYHDKKYRVQIPYCYYKSMQDNGICKVNMEVLNLVGGGQLISYMQVIPEED